LVPPGAVGELVIGGLGVAQGYHGRPDLTGEKFLVDDIVPAPGARMYRTGDLVRARSGEAGTFDYLGRIDFQVKVRGFRIELGEIESVLEAMPGIRQAVVSTWRDAAQELSLVAYFVSAGEPPAAKSLLEHARARLPAFMVPTAWVSLVEFPLTPNGKVDRKRLPPVGGQTPISRDVVEPRDDDERAMLAIFREKLGTSGIGVTDSFFDFGGHSLLALQVVRAVQERTGVTVPLVQIFRHPTVAGLVSSLRRDTKDAGHVIPLRDVGDGPLLYGICGIHLYQEVANSLGDGFRTYGVYIPADDHISSDVATGHELSVARDYWTTIKEHARGRPVSLIGLCYGGMIAYEVAALAEADGATVDLLVLADSPLWTHMRRDHWRRVQGVVRRLLAKGAAAVRSRLRASRLPRTAGLDGSARSDGRGDESGRDDALRLRAQAFRPSCRRRGETILLRSQNEELYGTWRDDPMIGWSSFLEGANHLLPIRCTHLGILKGDAAVRVAGLIRDVRAKRLLAP